MFDAALDSLMIVLALRLGGRRIHMLRVLAGALAGAFAAQLARGAALGQMHAALLWLPCAMLMMAIAGGGRSGKRVLRDGLLLLSAAGLLGGVVQALLGATGSMRAAYALGAAAFVVSALCMVRSRRAAHDAVHARVAIVCREKSAAFEAIIDSGNVLRDYLTALPVIVLPRVEAEKKLGVQAAALRPIFADTAGGRQMMSCFVPQQVTIRVDGKDRQVRAAAALAEGMRAGVPALVPAALLREEES